MNLKKKKVFTMIAKCIGKTFNVEPFKFIRKKKEQLIKKTNDLFLLCFKWKHRPEAYLTYELIEALARMKNRYTCPNFYKNCFLFNIWSIYRYNKESELYNTVKPINLKFKSQIFIEKCHYTFIWQTYLKKRKHLEK